MKALDKIELLEKIGTELQARMSFAEIDVYFEAHGINCKDIEPSANSKRIYAKEVLVKERDELIIQIADELNIPHSFSTTIHKEATFWKSGYFRLFISHISGFKAQTARLQGVLRKYAISSFVAHEDIEPSKEWQNEIEAGLHTMDALAAILMDGFKESNWCDQEVGVAVGRDVLIIPIRKGLDPYGFIGKYQGIQAQDKTIGHVAKDIFLSIIKSQKTRIKMIQSLSNAISQSTDVKGAIERTNLLKSINEIPSNILDNLKNQIADNNVLVKADNFINLLNLILEKNGVSKIVLDGQEKYAEVDELPF